MAHEQQAKPPPPDINEVSAFYSACSPSTSVELPANLGPTGARCHEHGVSPGLQQEQDEQATTGAPPHADAITTESYIHSRSHSHSHSHSHPHVHWEVKDGEEGEHSHDHDAVVEDEDEEGGGDEEESRGVGIAAREEEHAISDPLSDPAELKALTGTLSSYYLYRRTAHLNLTHQRRKGYWALSRKHREVLDRAMSATGEGTYVGMLCSLDDAIARNAELAEGIFASGVGAFGVPAEIPGEEHTHTPTRIRADDVVESEGGKEDEESEDGKEDEESEDGKEDGESEGGKEDNGKKPALVKGKKGKKPWWESHAIPEDMDKAKSTLKQLYRDWALEGHAERERCYKPVLDELCLRFPLNGDVDPSTTSGDGGAAKQRRRRDEIKVLVPGAGLGRLAFDIVCAGFESQGNEFSYHQLVASNFVLNCTSKVNEFTIHPFIHSFSHHLTRQNHLRSVQIPDVHPGHLLINHTSTNPRNPYSPSSSTTTTTPLSTPYSLPATRFSMIAGDFLQCYASEGSVSAWDAVCTVFFIDTAPNVIAYVETIYQILRKGGVWVNLGPLLWHWEGRDVPKRGAASKGSEGGGGIEVGGSVELTLEEVLGVVEACGFRIEKRGLRGGDEEEGMKGGGGGEVGEVRTGYIQDERSMLNYEYRAQFWVAVKV